jgi:hypothetical protein
MGAELGDGVADMLAHSRHADVQLLGDALGADAPGNQIEDRGLAIRQLDALAFKALRSLSV